MHEGVRNLQILLYERTCDDDTAARVGALESSTTTCMQILRSSLIKCFDCQWAQRLLLTKAEGYACVLYDVRIFDTSQGRSTRGHHGAVTRSDIAPLDDTERAEIPNYRQSDAACRV